MRRSTQDALLFGLVGFLAGAALGVIFSSVYVVLQSGGRFNDVEGLEIFNYAPWVRGSLQEPFSTGLMIIGGCAVICSIGFALISYRPKLTSHGSAKWATTQDLKRVALAVPLSELTGPIFAKLGTPRSRREFITSRDIPHSFICAPTGSGKGVGIVIPTLLTFGGSVICLDVKGENFEITANRRRALGDDVYCFSPLAADTRSHRFNPVDVLVRSPAERRFTEAQRMAESLIAMAGDNVQGFLVSAKQIFAAGLLIAVERGTPTIAAVHDLLSSGGDFAAMFEELVDTTEIDEAKSIFRRMAGTADRTLSAYMSVLFDGGLGAWRNGLVRAATASSDFDIGQLRRRPTSIYIVVAPNDLSVLAPVIRLLFQQVVAILQTAEPQTDEPYPVLLLLDEFPQLGRMSALSQAISTIRSYGGRIMIVAQSLSQLRAAYGADGAQNFLANCRLQLFMAPADSETPDYVSKSIGDFTRKARSKSWNMGQLGKSNIQEREEGARLLRPEELRSLPADKCVLLVQEADPIMATKVRYYEDRFLAPLALASTEHKTPVPKLTLPVQAASLAEGANEQSPESETNGPDGDDISIEDFTRVRAAQSDLLGRIRDVQDTTPTVSP